MCPQTSAWKHTIQTSVEFGLWLKILMLRVTFFLRGHTVLFSKRKLVGPRERERESEGACLQRPDVLFKINDFHAWLPRLLPVSLGTTVKRCLSVSLPHPVGHVPPNLLHQTGNLSTEGLAREHAYLNANVIYIVIQPWTMCERPPAPGHQAGQSSLRLKGQSVWSGGRVPFPTRKPLLGSQALFCMLSLKAIHTVPSFSCVFWTRTHLRSWLGGEGRSPCPSRPWREGGRVLLIPKRYHLFKIRSSAPPV